MIEAFREFLPSFSGGASMWPRWRGSTGTGEGKNGRRKLEDEIVEAGIEKKTQRCLKLATKRVLEVLEKLREDVAAEIKAIWEGFSRFINANFDSNPIPWSQCRSTLALVHLHEVRDALDGVQPAPTFVDEYDASLHTKIWRRPVRR